MPRSSLRSALILTALFGLILTASGSLWLAPPTLAQIDNNPPLRPYASVVDCIRPGSDIDGSLPSDTSPRFAVSCFGSAWNITNYEGAGNPANADAAFTHPAVVEFGDGKPDASGVEPGHTTRASLGTNGSTGGGTGIGAVNGLAYASGSNPASSHAGESRLYAGAYTKRMTRFGTAGPGAIYLLDRGTNNERLFVQVPGVVPGPGGAPGNPGDGSQPTFPNSQTAATYDPFTGGIHTTQHDNGSLGMVGRTGLGDLDIDPQERYLYGVNLFYRAVFRVDTWSSNPQGSLTYLPALPMLSDPNTCNASGASGPQDLHPFGLAVTADSLYLGFVCSGATSGQRMDLAAGVARFSLTSSSWDPGLATAFGLTDYDAQRVGAPPTYFGLGWWQIWNDAGPAINGAIDPQAMLTDITFDEQGRMLLGLRDRFSDLSLSLVYGNAILPEGDLLLANPSGTPYRWSQPVTTPPEYFNDNALASPSGDPPEEAGGGIAYIPGRHDGTYGGEVISTFADPYVGESFGAAWFDMTGGSPTAREEIYAYPRTPSSFAKAGGLGDVELLCTWRAIGDRVWRDANANGTQDAGEPDINGVLLNLRDSGGSVVAQVTTGSVAGMSGNYRFYVDPFRSYTVEIAPSNYTAGGALFGLALTPPNIGSDTTDSDANALNQITAAPAGNGDVNVTFDAGLVTGANVRIAKSGPASAAVGSNFSYTLSYANDGPAPAANVTVVDTLPAGLTYVSASPSPSSISGQTLTWNLGTLAAGASGSIAVVVSVQTSAPASVTNTVTISTTTTGDNAGDNTATVTTPITRPNVTIDKTGPATVAVGDSFSYTLTYRNTGTAPAAGVTVVDTLPAGIAFVSATPAPASVSGQTLTWNLGTLAAGASGTITLNVQAHASAPASVTNSVTIATTSSGDDPSDNTDTQVTQVIRPNVMVAKTGPATATVGDQVSYTITASNTGTSSAANVTVVDTLPSGLSFVSASPSPSSVSGQMLTWDLGTLASGASTSITVVAQSSAALPNGTSVTNNVTISTSSGGDTPGDNTGSVTTLLQRADVYVTKSSPTSFPVVSGQSVTYLIDYGNAGPATARNVTLSDPAPTQLSNVTWTCEAGCSQSGSGSINLSLGDLAPGATGRIRVTGTATTSVAREDFVNTATIATSTPETRTDNNQSSVPGAVWTTDLQLIKLAASQVTAGTTFTATLQYRNNGPAPAEGVVLTDTLPGGVSFVSSNPAPASVAGQTVTWNLGTLADAQSGTIELVLLADAAIPDGTTVTNQAALTSTTTDRNTSNEGDTADTLVIARSDVQVVKTGPAAVNAGDSLTFTISYTNAGPSLARSVVVSDTLPSELDFISATPAPSSSTNGVLTWNIGDLPPGASGSITVQMQSRVDQTVATLPATNLVSVTTPTTDPDPSNNTDEHTTEVQTVDLSILKDMPGFVVAGSEFTATLTYRNAGPASARSVTLRDFVPAGLTFVRAVPPPSASGPRWSLSALAPGATGTLEVVFRVPTTAISGTTYLNTAIIDTSMDTDRDGSNNSGSDTSIVRPNADLVIIKTGTPGPILSSSPITYTLNYRNNGPSQATGVILTDTPPAGFTFSSSTPPSTGTNNGVLSWSLGDLDAGVSGTITVNGTLSATAASSTLINTAVIASAVTPDPYPDNNTDTHPVVVQQPDLSVTKDDGLTTVQPGDVLTYTLSVRNSGPVAAAGVTLTETPPAGATVLSSSWIAQPNGTYTLDIGTVSARATVTRQFVVRLPSPLATATVVNTVQVAIPNTPDPTPDDTSDTDTDDVLSGTIGDTVWRDDDGDGVQDTGEPGLSGITVQLLSANGRSVLATAVTDASGMYLFQGLRLDTYQVQIAPETTLIGSYFGYRVTTEPIQVATLTPSLPQDLARDFGLCPAPTTDVTLAYFRAQRSDGGVLLTWKTLDERGTDHFVVLRGVTGDRSQASVLGTRPSQGSTGGTYSLVDTTHDGPVYYWLIEVERDGSQNIVGWIWPAAVQGGYQVSLPLVIR